jgi:signal transduction histidine kinase
MLREAVEKSHGLTVHIHVRGKPTPQSEALTMFLFRAAQEMPFNVVKRTGVHEAGVWVRRRGRYLCLSVLDHGCGFDPQGLGEASRLGLLSIRERVELLGERMKIRSVKGGGSRCYIVVPDTESLVKCTLAECRIS